MSDRGIAGAAAATALAIFLLGSLALCSSAEKADARDADPWSGARGACMLQVKRQLHDPGSAEFGIVAEWPMTPRADGAVQVLAIYRAKNGFGAMRQSTTACKVSKVEGGFRVALSP